MSPAGQPGSLLELRGFGADASGAPGPGDDSFNPFPGLRSFEPQEDYLFFGRDRHIDDLLRRLRLTRFVAVLGTSGCGKSSLVRAGLIPSLQGGAMAGTGSGWRIAVFRPGWDPFGNLEKALAGALLDPESPTYDLDRPFLEVTLRASGLGLVNCVRQAGLPDGEKLLVVADQFEELFRFKREGDQDSSRDEALAFVRLLLEATRPAGPPIYVVLTMRSDYINRCMEFSDLPEAINDGLYLVPRMTRDELRAAITAPVAVAGAGIAPGLVVRLLNDIGDDQDQLPILQHALMRTWEKWRQDHAEGEEVGPRHYMQAGTMSGALDQHAEEAYEEVRNLPRGEEIAEKLFRALTEKDRDGQGVRRPMRLSELAGLIHASEAEIAAVAESFRRRSFLMPPPEVELGGDDMLDLSHESLMRIWSRLTGWVNAEARSAQTFRDLARDEAKHRQATAGLLRDPELQLALDWRRDERPTKTWGERYEPGFDLAMSYLEESEKARDQERKDREAARRRQLWLARCLALVLGATAVLSLVFFLIVDAKSRELEKQTKSLIDTNGQLKKKTTELEGTTTKLLMKTKELNTTIDALGLSQKVEKAAKEREFQARKDAEANQRKAEAQTRWKELALKAANRATATADRAHEGETLAAQREKLERDKAVALEAKTRGQRLLSLAGEMALQNLRPQHSDKLQLSALLTVQAYLFNRHAGGLQDQPDINMALREALRRLNQEAAPPKLEDAVRAMAYTQDEGFLTADEEGNIRSLSPGSKPGWTRQAMKGGVRSLALSKKGKFLAVGGMKGELWIWNMKDKTAAPSFKLTGSDGRPIIAVAFASEEQLVSAKADGGVSLWDVKQDAKPILLLPPNAEHVYSIDASGGRVAVATDRGAVLLSLHKPAEQPSVACFLGQKKENAIRSVAFGPGGELACGTASGEVRLMSAAGRADEPLTGHSSAVNALAFSPDGRFMASASSDKTVRLWNLSVQSKPRPIVLEGHKSWVWTVAFSSDGRQLASGSEDQTVRFWRVRSEDLVSEICRRVGHGLSRDEWRVSLPEDLPYEDYEKACAISDNSPR